MYRHWRQTPERCRDCGANWDWAHHQGHGYCIACYRWHQRHGWDKPRPSPPKRCRDCGRPWGVRGCQVVLYHARGYCNACYVRQRRQKRQEAM